MEWILVFLMTVKQPDGTVRHSVPVTTNVPTDIDTCQAQLKMLRKSKTHAGGVLASGPAPAGSATIVNHSNGAGPVS